MALGNGLHSLFLPDRWVENENARANGTIHAIESGRTECGERQIQQCAPTAAGQRGRPRTKPSNGDKNRQETEPHQPAEVRELQGERGQHGAAHQRHDKRRAFDAAH